jgi:hypothetical protein
LGEELPKCFGRQWPTCEQLDCRLLYACQLAYQEEVAIPRMEKEMTVQELTFPAKESDKKK